VDAGLVIALVVVAVTLASVLVYAGIGRSLNEWRRRASEPLAGRAPEGELREEVRASVLALNDRRSRRGEPQLDIDAEVERRLREFELDIN
jgi:hypothetical protein